MKRTDAVKILQNIVLEHMNCVCCHDDETMYSTMLKEIEEKIGMKPPEILVNEHIYIRESGDYGWYENEWEPENA